MIQDIAPHHLNNQFVPGKTAQPGDPVFHFKGNELLCSMDEDGRIILPCAKDIEGAKELLYLFAVDETDYYLAMGEDVCAQAPFEHRVYYSHNERSEESKLLMFAIFTALHLSHWYNANHFCSRCGTPLKHSETERALICPDCGQHIYPRLNPAVIVGVLNGDKMLVTRYAGRKFALWALIAGFTEIGETFEECVAREVMEETGVRVKNIRYYKSQPWGMVDDILAGFFCDLDGDDTIHLDREELKEGKWVTRDEIELQPNEYSLTNEMMRMFKEGKVSGCTE